MLILPKKLTIIVGFWNKFEPSLTVGISINKFKDFSVKYPKIKNFIDDNTNENLQYNYDYVDNIFLETVGKITSEYDENQNTWKDCIVCYFKELQIYNLHSLAYSHLF